MIPDKFGEFVIEVGNTTRSVCRRLCSETYNLTCSGFLYNRRVQSCQLSPYTGEWVTTDGLSVDNSSRLEFYRRLRCVGQTASFLFHLLATSPPSPGSGLKYCDERVCTSVCLSARMSPKTARSNFTEFFLYVLTVAAAWSSSDDKAIRYVFPVLWTTSSLPIIGQAKATPTWMYSE